MQFKIQVGDWSKDGHGKSSDILVNVLSEHSIEQIREAYFDSQEAVGFNLADICADDGDSFIQDSALVEVLDFLNKEGYDKLHKAIKAEEGFMDPYLFAELTVAVLMTTDPSLNLLVTPPRRQKPPTLHFFGSDSKGRHIPQLGYGLF